MQCVEHVVAQRIANLRVQNPEIAPLYLLKHANSDLLRPVFLYPTNALQAFASGLEAHVGQRPVRGGKAIKTHRKGNHFEWEEQMIIIYSFEKM